MQIQLKLLNNNQDFFQKEVLQDSSLIIKNFHVENIIHIKNHQKILPNNIKKYTIKKSKYKIILIR